MYARSSEPGATGVCNVSDVHSRSESRLAAVSPRAQDGLQESRDLRLPGESILRPSQSHVPFGPGSSQDTPNRLGDGFRLAAAEAFPNSVLGDDGSDGGETGRDNRDTRRDVVAQLP